MSKHAKHVPQHRGAPASAHLSQAPRKALRTTVILTSVAAAATGATVASGVLTTSGGVTEAAADVSSQSGGGELAQAAARAAADVGERRAVVSRSASDRRDASDPAKEATLNQTDGLATTQTEDLSDADPREAARALLSEFGFSSDQFGCLDSLWTRESGWSSTADNPSSSAYGIPQALPGSKMSSAGSDWATNPVTQIRWGLGYIQDRYGSPCSAWGHSESNGWY